MCPWWYWRDPASGRVTFAFGTAWERRPEGDHRFREARDALAAVVPAVYAVDDARARWFAGFAFAPGLRREPWAGWPDAWLWLPFCRLEQEGTEVIATFVVPVRRTGDEAVADTANLAHHTRLLDLMSHTDAQSPATSLAGGDSAAVRECPDMSTWMETVAKCAAVIRGGSIEKVVLARSVQHRRCLCVRRVRF
jgi:isochorismate synthase EntC